MKDLFYRVLLIIVLSGLFYLGIIFIKIIIDLVLEVGG